MEPLINLDKIVWAVDPFAERVMLQRAAAWVIYELTKTNPSSLIQPVYLVNDFSGEGIIPQRLVRSFIEKIEVFGNDSLNRITHKIPLKNMRPLQIISTDFASIEQGVRELVRSAEHSGGHLIVASTRAGKAGRSPLALPGSFVETLADLSELPVMVVNPRWRRVTGMPSILFLTDLSPESHHWYLRTLDFAKKSATKVTLFHRVNFPLSQPFEVASRIFPDLRNTLYRKIKQLQAEAREWAQDAKKAGVKVSVRVDSKMVGSLSEAILNCLEHHPGSVVIAPPLSMSYPRSTIRKLIRGSSFPVIYIPTLLRKETPALGIRSEAA